MAVRIPVHHDSTGIIMQRTLENALLSSPEGYYQQSVRIGKVAANAAKASVAYMGRLPAAGTLVSVHATASTINNVALATPPLCVWIGNGTSALLTGSGVIVPSTAFRVTSGALSTASAGQAAGTDIYAAAKTSTTTSGLGIYATAVWKLYHTT